MATEADLTFTIFLVIFHSVLYISKKMLYL